MPDRIIPESTRKIRCPPIFWIVRCRDSYACHGVSVVNKSNTLKLHIMPTALFSSLINKSTWCFFVNWGIFVVGAEPSLLKKNRLIARMANGFWRGRVPTVEWQVRIFRVVANGSSPYLVCSPKPTSRISSRLSGIVWNVSNWKIKKYQFVFSVKPEEIRFYYFYNYFYDVWAELYIDTV